MALVLTEHNLFIYLPVQCRVPQLVFVPYSHCIWIPACALILHWADMTRHKEYQYLYQYQLVTQQVETNDVDSVYGIHQISKCSATW